MRPLVVAGSNSDATTLPQDPEADTAARKKELKEKKDVYEWNFEVSASVLSD